MEEEQQAAKFNMALNTLERLGNILDQIKIIQFHPHISNVEKQNQKISLVKNFFIQASPLFSKEVIAKYQKEILDLKLQTERKLQRRDCLPAINAGFGPVYSEQLNVRMDEILIELQQILQEEKYFMPPADADEGEFD